MDPASLAAGLIHELGGFSGGFGPVVLVIVGFAVGLYGINLCLGMLRNYVISKRDSGPLDENDPTLTQSEKEMYIGMNAARKKRLGIE